MLRTRKNLRKYQARASLDIVQKKRLGLFVDMSLGKTAITLTAYVNLKTQGKVPYGMWVIAPLSVTKSTWQEEAQQWEHLKDLTFTLVEHKRPSKRLEMLKEPTDIKVISYTLLPWLYGALPRKRSRRKATKGRKTLVRPDWAPSMLVLDESEHVKGRGAWFRAVRYGIMRWAPYRVIQTGTPAAHSLFDLWPQIYILDKGERLGSSFENYRGRFFQQADYNGFRYEPRPGAERLIYQLLSDCVVRLDGDDWLQLPKIIPNDVYVDLPPTAMELYRRHEREMFIRLDNLKEVEAANAAVLSGQCWQLANGAIYDDLELRDSWTEIHRAKLNALAEIIESAVGNPMIVAYWFRHDRERLKKAYPDAMFMSKKNITECKDLWNKGKLPLLFMNPQNVSHGLNMQFGGHMITWFSQIWSGGRHNQLIARLRRPDQRSPHVISTYITARNTVDEVIKESRERRLRGQSALLDALRAYRRRSRN